MSKVREFFGIYTKRNDVNWKMSAKTILIQMHHKIETFEYLGKHLVLVVQDCFYDYMVREFSFSHFEQARQGDSVHIHSYSLCETDNNSLRLMLKGRTSTDANGIALCLGLQAEAKIELEKIINYLEAKISENTLIKIV